MIGGMYIFERFTKRIDVRIPERVLSRFIFDIPTLMLFKVLKIEIWIYDREKRRYKSDETNILPKRPLKQ